MAKKQDKESPDEQARRFAKQVQDMIDAGELNPTEADEAMERVMKKVASAGAPNRSHDTD